MMVQVLVSLLPKWETQMELFASSPALCTVVICKISQQMNDSLFLNLSAFQISISCLKKKIHGVKNNFQHSYSYGSSVCPLVGGPWPDWDIP